MTDTTQVDQDFEDWYLSFCGHPTKDADSRNEMLMSLWAWQAATERATPKWQPIETAPKAVTVLLYSVPKANSGQFGRVAGGYWLQTDHAGNGAWIWPYVDTDPTHWALLPTPPAFRQGGDT